MGASTPDLTVTNLHMTSPNDGRPNPSFAWDANANAVGYQISSDGGLNWIDIGLITSYTFSGLVDGNYNIVVRAYADSAVSSVAVPLFGGFGALLLTALFGLVALRRIREN